MKVTKLKEHLVIEYLMSYTHPYIVRCGPENINKIQPSPSERKAIEVAISLSNITECIDQLYYSIELLSAFRKRSSKQLMNRHDYIVYSIENFFLRITSVFDRCLRSSNYIFNIGIPERECRESTIIKNTKIKGTSVEKALKSLNTFTNDFNKKRNKIAHANSFSDPNLNDIQEFYLVLDSETNLDNGTSEIDIYKNMFKKEADKYVSTQKNEFLKYIKRLEEIVDQYFTAILPRVKIIIEEIAAT